jgi:hypothetical protein
MRVERLVRNGSAEYSELVEPEHLGVTMREEPFGRKLGEAVVSLVFVEQ